MTALPAEAPARLYCQLMVAIKARLRRLDAVTVWSTPGRLGPKQLYEIEAAMLCLRKVLELMAFCSLVANEEATAQAIRDIGAMWKAQKILDNIEKVNPDFFPVSVELQGVAGGVITFTEKSNGDALERSEFPFLFDLCGEFLHVRNPFSTEDPPEFRRPPSEWLQRIRALLNVHLVRLAGGELGIVEMNGWGTAAPGFHHAGPPSKPAAWGTGSKAQPLPGE